MARVSVSDSILRLFISMAVAVTATGDSNSSNNPSHKQALSLYTTIQNECEGKVSGRYIIPVYCDNTK